jgi:cytochrome P450
VTKSSDGVPAHVPSDLIVDFDFLRVVEGDEDPFFALKRLHEGPDIFWATRNQGHWVATRGDDIRQILSDHETFSSRTVFLPVVDRPRIIPTEIDPPEHAAYRALIAPFFYPNAIGSWADEARRLAASLIDGFYAKGECEFISDFALQLPIIIFMKMCDLPLDDREKLLSWVGPVFRPKSDTDAQEGRGKMNAYVTQLVAERRARPRNDMLSQMLTKTIDGRPLSNAEGINLASTMLLGGLDTVASSMGWMARFLAEHPGHRRQLIDDPKLIANAVEELLRRFSIPTIARIVAKDSVYKGVAMKEGDPVLMSACLHGMDERSFENPLEVDFRRADARRHSVFSQGIHRCPGSTLALAEFRVVLEVWLNRIPDFWIKPGAKVRTGSGFVHTVLSLPLAWEAKELGGGR